MTNDKHSRLVEEAIILKKAFLLIAVLGGHGNRLGEQDRKIPNYQNWENKSLKRHLADLEDDIERFEKPLLLNWTKTNSRSRARWFSSQFDEWAKVGFGIHELGRVHEVETAVGRLAFHQIMDCPPYAQLLMQGLHNPALRHPEYHLGSDLALLFNLLLDSEAILADSNQRSKVHCSEHSQSLARSVILTSFNLLESFISGLAVAWLIENPCAPANIVSKLEDKKMSLRRRLVEFPSLITGRQKVIDGNCAPFDVLFGECKQRRDSFVHCEPGPKPTVWGYVKEQQFHSVDLATVRRTVDLTFQAICQIWKAVHGSEKPSWLPTFDNSGRFERVTVKLVATDTELPARHTPSK
jgi:hypothetical protein